MACASSRARLCGGQVGGRDGRELSGQLGFGRHVRHDLSRFCQPGLRRVEGGVRRGGRAARFLVGSAGLPLRLCGCFHLMLGRGHVIVRRVGRQRGDLLLAYRAVVAHLELLREEGGCVAAARRFEALLSTGNVEVGGLEPGGELVLVLLAVCECGPLLLRLGDQLPP